MSFTVSRNGRREPEDADRAITAAGEEGVHRSPARGRGDPAGRTGTEGKACPRRLGQSPGPCFAAGTQALLALARIGPRRSPPSALDGLYNDRKQPADLRQGPALQAIDPDTAKKWGGPLSLASDHEALESAGGRVRRRESLFIGHLTNQRKGTIWLSSRFQRDSAPPSRNLAGYHWPAAGRVGNTELFVRRRLDGAAGDCRWNPYHTGSVNLIEGH